MKVLLKNSLLAALAAVVGLASFASADLQGFSVLPHHRLLRGEDGMHVARRAQVSSGDVTCSNQGTFYTYKYGLSEASDGYDNQVADVYLPSKPVATPTPVVVLIHGGYWYDSYRRNTNNGSSMVDLALDLQARGYVAVNLEYRRAAAYVGNDGGYTGTYNDLTDGIDALQFVKSECGFSADLDLGRIVLAGHSAGGHLALWRTLSFGITTADRDSTSGTPEYLHAPALNPIAAIGLAAVSNFGCACSSFCSSGKCDSGFCGTASCGAITNFMSYGTHNKNEAEIGNDLQVWSPYQMIPNAHQDATNPIPIKLIHCSSDTTVSPQQSDDFETEASQFSNIDASVENFSGGHFDVVDPTHPSWACGASQFLTSILEPLPDPACTVVDFESGSSGWTADASSTCSTGDFVVGTPGLVESSGVVTQVCGDHTTGTGSAFFSAPNTAAGTDDVDGGECIGLSPTYQVTQESTVSIWYFHGQRDAGGDSGDFFVLEMSTDGGTNWVTLASYGDEQVDAVWQKASATVPSNSDVVFRVRVSDGASAGDLVEAGVDDLVICPTGPSCVDDSDCNDGVFCNGAETCQSGACVAGTDPCTGQMCDEDTDTCVQCLINDDCDDGQYCNGAETCQGGVCQAGTAVVCSDSYDCTADTCNETTDSCDFTPDDTLCSNGDFCDGEEICNPSAGCQNGTAPCTGEMCDENTDACVECLIDGDCDDSLFCNGAETCQSGACVAGTDPCTGQVCDEATDACSTVVKVAMVVKNPDDIEPEEQLRINQMTSWGFIVSVIEAKDSQAAFDAMASMNDVFYVSDSFGEGDADDELLGMTIGIVIEYADMANEFGIAKSVDRQDSQSIDITDNTHFITSGFSTGVLEVLSTENKVMGLKPSYAVMTTLAETAVPGKTVYPALVTVAAGSTLRDNMGTAAGRRVILPWGKDSLDFVDLNADGLELMRLAVLWAAGSGDD